MKRAKNMLVKKRYISVLCLLLGLVINSQVIWAQENDQIEDNNVFVSSPLVQSPDVAALAKYIDFPVSQYTGQVNVSIPIYELTAGDISLPISLSYHTSGIKVTDVASWVGLGWSLNAGG